MNIPRNLYETNNSYMRRVWFVNQYSPKTNHELIKAITLSNIWINMLILKCKYDKKIELEIIKIFTNIKNKTYNFNKL